MQIDMDKLWGKFWDQVALKQESLALKNERAEDQLGWDQIDREHTRRMRDREAREWHLGGLGRQADRAEDQLRLQKVFEKPKKKLTYGGIIRHSPLSDPYEEKRNRDSTYSSASQGRSGTAQPLSYSGGTGNSVGPVGFGLMPTTTIRGTAGSRKKKKRKLPSLNPGPPPRNIPPVPSLSSYSSGGW